MAKRGVTRERLIAVASDIVREEGVSALRLRSIAQRTDLAIGAVYHHFATKEDLLAAVIQRTVESLISPVNAEAEANEDPAMTVAISHQWFLTLATREPQLAGLLVNLAEAEKSLGDALRARGRQMIERGVAQGRFREADIDVHMTFTFGATIALIRAVLAAQLDQHAVVVESTISFMMSLGIEHSEALEIAQAANSIAAGFLRGWN